MTQRAILLSVVLQLLTSAANAAPPTEAQTRPVAPIVEEIYNEGVALYRESQWDAAAEKFRQSSRSGNQELAAKSRFNLGNCEYAKALEVAQNGGQTTDLIPLLQNAVENFRTALRLDLTDQDARANLELAVHALDRLNESKEENGENQSESNEEQQQNKNRNESQHDDETQEANQPQADQPEENPGEEQNQPETAQEQEEVEQQQPQDRSSDDAKNEPSEKEQESEGNEESPDDGEAGSESNDEKANREPSDSSNQSPSSRQQDSGSSTEQSKQNDGQESKPAEPESNNQEPADSRGSLEATNQTSEESQNQGYVDQLASDGNEGRLMTQQEAMKMLQAIRDRDLRRRYQHERNERSRYIPVDRDW